LERQLRGRVMVAHNAPFDRRVLRQAFDRIGLQWPDPPVLCTAQLARVLLPLQRERRLAVLADALGIEVESVHRALADARALQRPRRRPRPGGRASRRRELQLDFGLRAARAARLDFGELPQDPGVYLFRDGTGRTLYVGKS